VSAKKPGGSQCLNVLIVDDSPFACRAIARMLRTDPRLNVIGHAIDGHDALRMAAELPVDVITLDLEMPGLDGLQTLARLREQGPIPVVILSSAAGAGAAATLRALDLGAFDVVAKPQGGPMAIHQASRELVAKVCAAGGLDERVDDRPEHPAPSQPPVVPVPTPVTRKPSTASRASQHLELVIIATSTGGPAALQAILPALPLKFPVPVLVLQHMPPGYTRALAERLDRISALEVREAIDGDRFLPGCILVAPAGRQLSFSRVAGTLVASVHDTCPFPSYYKPSIDFTFGDAAREVGAGVLAVVLTGMGSDGASGLKAIKLAGGVGWAQDEATSTIYGMPRAALDTGCVDEVLALTDVAPRLTALLCGLTGPNAVC
jgi:two-component system chemotaxis response regulator CheB